MNSLNVFLFSIISVYSLLLLLASSIANFLSWQIAVVTRRLDMREN